MATVRAPLLRAAWIASTICRVLARVTDTDRHIFGPHVLCGKDLRVRVCDGNGCQSETHQNLFTPASDQSRRAKAQEDDFPASVNVPGDLGQFHLAQHLFRICKTLAVVFKHAVEDTPGAGAFNKFFQSDHIGTGHRRRQVQLKFPIAFVTQAPAESIDGGRARPTNLGQAPQWTDSGHGEETSEPPGRYVLPHPICFGDWTES